MSTPAHMRRKALARRTRAAALGRRLKNARMARELSQEQVADHLGLSRSAVTQWETGDTSPDLPMIERIATYLQTTPEFLCFGIDAGAVSTVSVPVVDFTDTKQRTVAQLGIEQDFFLNMGIVNLATLKAFVINDDPGISGVSRGDRVVIDEGNKRIASKTMIGLMVQGEPRVAVATMIPSTDAKPSARVMMGDSEMEVPLHKLDIIGVVTSVLHGQHPQSAR